MNEFISNQKEYIEKTVEQQTNPTVAEREYKRNKEIQLYTFTYSIQYSIQALYVSACKEKDRKRNERG